MGHRVDCLRPQTTRAVQRTFLAAPLPTPFMSHGCCSLIVQLLLIYFSCPLQRRCSVYLLPPLSLKLLLRVPASCGFMYPHCPQETNFLGTRELTDKMVPLLRGPSPRIINVSSR